MNPSVFDSVTVSESVSIFIPTLRVSVFELVQVYESGIGATQTMPVSQDTFFGSVFVKGPNGSLATLTVGGWADHYYAFIQFNLSNIPYSIGSAKVLVTLTSANPASPLPTLERNNQSWDENTLTDLNFPTSTGTIYTPDWINVAGVVDSFNIPEIAQLWATGTLNAGVVIKPTVINNNNFAILASSNASNSATRPVFTVTPAVTVQVSGTPLLIQVWDAVTASENSSVSPVSFKVSVFEAVTISESFSKTVITTLLISLSDSVTVAESVSGVVAWNLFVFDATVTSESIGTFLPILSLSAFDTILTVESFTSFVPIRSLPVFETVTVSDSYVPGIIPISIFDIVSTGENFASDTIIWSYQPKGMAPIGTISFPTWR